MPSTPLKSLPPRQLVLVGIIALVAAGAIVANGLIGRSRNQQELLQWTNAQAVPTVTLAKLTRGDADQKLILPGDIQPYGRATVYSRVNGYLKSWNTDIGAHVKLNDVLASIEAPDLD
jgi:multidrug efflux pump subunit AcrA (membrane-fusion protein)